MKKNYFKIIALSSLISGSSVFSQVGINTDSPKATLDVVKSPTSQVLDGMIAPRITADDLNKKNYSSEQTGAFLYITDAFSSSTLPTSQTSTITTPGYYVFDGLVWKTFSPMGWSLSGNSSLNDSNFLGTTDANSLRFKVNNTNSGILENNEYGTVSIGKFSFSGPKQNLGCSAFGTRSLSSLTTGIHNASFGIDALGLLTTGFQNSAFGANSGKYLTGNSNSFFGYLSGGSITTGNNNTHVGTGSPATEDVSNTIILGCNSRVMANESIIVGSNSLSRGNNNYIATTILNAARNNVITIGNYIATGASGLINNRVQLDNELIINNYTSSTDDSIPLIRGNFTEGAKYLRIGGRFILDPTLTADASGDLAYTKNVVAKADGTIGFSSISTPIVTVNSTTTSRVRLANDITSSTTSRTTIPTWNFNVSNGKIYKIKILGAYSTAVTTTGGSLGFVLTDGAAGTIFGKVKMNIVHTNTAAPEQVITAIDTSSTTVRSFVTSTGVGTVNVPEVIDGELIFECTADGVINLQWGSEVASSTATLLKNSILEVTEI